MSNSLTFDQRTSQSQNLATGWDYFALFKPRVMGLVIFTGFAGSQLAPGTLHPFLYIVSILCIAIGAGASGALNMWYERDIDALMYRTRNRPLPSKRIPADDALMLGIILSIFSIVTLGFAANYYAAGWLAFTISFYAFFYTIILKRNTPENIVIGGAAGALPPLIGWVAISPEFNWAPLSLVSIIFLWTPPHFWALALCQEADYKRASVPMLPITHGRNVTTRRIFLYTLATVAASTLPYYLGVSGLIYLGTALISGFLFIAFTVQLWRYQDNISAIRVFKYSIIYMFIIYLFLLIDHWIGIL